MDPSESKRRTKRYSRNDLLREGLSILSEGGIDTLTIDALCTRLGVTKGSFYHHFGGRTKYLESLLDYWANVWTLERMRASDSGTSPRERFESIVGETEVLPADPETSIRAWAVRDDLARSYQEQVDTERVRYLESIFFDATKDEARAAMLARIGYSLFVGSRVIAPPLSGEQRMAMIEMVKEELYRFPE